MSPLLIHFSFFFQRSAEMQQTPNPSMEKFQKVIKIVFSFLFLGIAFWAAKFPAVCFRVWSILLFESCFIMGDLQYRLFVGIGSWLLSSVFCKVCQLCFSIVLSLQLLCLFLFLGVLLRRPAIRKLCGIPQAKVFTPAEKAQLAQFQASTFSLKPPPAPTSVAPTTTPPIVPPSTFSHRPKKHK
jgi:hypothetical protein